MHKLTAFVLAIFFAKEGLTQAALQDTTQQPHGIQAAIDSYFQSINDGAGIYNGVEHSPYFGKYEGFAYYNVDNWQTATIEYSGVVYRNIPVKYDLVKDQLIVRHPSGFSLILFSPRVTYFIIGDDKFIYMPEGGNKVLQTPGFYQELRTGTLTALAKRRKLIEEKIEGQELNRRFLTVNKYYVKKDGVYFNLKKESSLLELMHTHRTEVKQVLRKGKIRFRKNPERALLAAVDYYNKQS